MKRKTAAQTVYLLGCIAFFWLSAACTAMGKVTENKQNMYPIHDKHTLANPHEVRVKHLDLEIAVDFEKQVIHGKATWAIDNISKGKTLVLDTKGLIIHKVTLDDESHQTAFGLGEPVTYLGSALSIQVKADTKYVHIAYETSTGSDALQWLQPTQTAGKQYPFLFTQGQAILSRTWFPCQDSPGVRFTYKAKVVVPKELMAVMSATNPIIKNENGIYNFEMDQAIPAYLVALAVGDITFKPVGGRTGVYAEPLTLNQAVYEFSEMEQMLTTAEALYGAYSWGRYDLLVLPPSFPFGGMENPRLTFATPTILAGDRSLTSLVAHELAHAWSGNLVTNATWDDFWLNEGFTVYFERRIMEKLHGSSYADMLAVLGYQDLVETIEEIGKDNEATCLKLNLSGRDPDDGMSDIAYEKGYFLLLTIERAVGRPKFDVFLETYFLNYAFQSMDTEKFVAYLRKNLFMNNEALWQKVNPEAWIYKPGLPVNCPKPTSQRFDAVEKILDMWINSGKVNKLSTNEWTSHEFVHFLRKLPSPLSTKQMVELDQVFDFTHTRNAEIAFVWFLHCINNKYQPAYASIDNFLVHTGRRKFVRPLYKAMLNSHDGAAMAANIYKKARPNYHYVTANSIDELMRDK